MTEKRNQGPHYIPELDPERTGDPGGWLTKLLWASVVGKIVGGVGLVWAVASGANAAVAVFGAVFIVSLIVFVAFAFLGLAGG